MISFGPSPCFWFCPILCVPAPGTALAFPAWQQAAFAQNKARWIHLKELLNLASCSPEKWLVNRFICHKFLAEWFLQMTFSCRPFANSLNGDLRLFAVGYMRNFCSLGSMNIAPRIRFLAEILFCIKSIFTFYRFFVVCGWSCQGLSMLSLLQKNTYTCA